MKYDKLKTLKSMYPEIARQWHYEKNGDMDPGKITPGSGKKVWWRCEKGHEWENYIYNRTRGFGCPFCSGRRPTRDNNLLAIKPDVAKQWHPFKNKNLRPEQVSPNSHRKVWWQCEKGHEWIAFIYKMNKKPCPYCYGRKVGSDNNLAAVHPVFAKQWHPSKNGTLKPSQIFYRSHKTVWWQCEKGHEWKSKISTRNQLLSGCPYCKRRRASSLYNLQVVNPKLAAQWHPWKNKSLTPVNVTPNSTKRVWWKCEKGHEWQAKIAQRAYGLGCPFCAGRKPSPDYCLAAVNPKLAREWHPDKNGNLTPDKVTPHSGQKVWWKCKRGHEWQAKVNGRQSGTGCRICSYLDMKERDQLAYESPELAEEWHPTANGDLTPFDVTACSGRRVWWMCKKGHEWEACIGSRFRYKSGCPYCSNNKVCSDNCLATVNPDLAKQWHPTKNGDLKPTQVTGKTRKKVWWMCERGHSWEAIILHRAYGHGCPYCAGSKATKEYNLKTKNPALAKLLHPTKNGTLTSEQVAPQSGLKVWWKCEKGHEWQAIVRHVKNGCPICKKK